MTHLRVMTYNIRLGGRRRAALRDVVRAAAPDVLLVNESPKLPMLSRRGCRRLAESWRMAYVGGGRSAGSNMLAVGPAVRVRWVRTSAFETPPLRPRRGVVSAQLRIEGRLVGVVGVHLSLDHDRRLDEVEGVIAAAGRLRGPVIVAGDLNETPGGASWERLREAGFRDHGTPQWRTFPAHGPERRIDAVLVRGEAAVVSHGDPGVPAELLERASDHRPVLAVVDV